MLYALISNISGVHIWDHIAARSHPDSSSPACSLSVIRKYRRRLRRCWRSLGKNALAPAPHLHGAGAALPTTADIIAYSPGAALRGAIVSPAFAEMFEDWPTELTDAISDLAERFLVILRSYYRASGLRIL